VFAVKNVARPQGRPFQGSDGDNGEVVMEVEPDSVGGGFIVDPALLGGVAVHLGSASDEFSAAIGQYGSQCFTASAFGSDVAAAWSDFDTAWGEKLNATGARLGQLISKVTTTREHYSAAESSNVSIINVVGG
jgi:hypothetical protein